MKWAPGHIYYSYEKPKKGEPAEFSFSAESWGQLPVKEALTCAMDILDKKMDDFVKALQ